VALRAVDEADRDRFPFDVPAIRTMTALEFTSPVTFLVGENGSGKSTFLESVASAAGMIAVGSADLDRDRTLEAVRRLAERANLPLAEEEFRGGDSDPAFQMKRRLLALDASWREIPVADMLAGRLRQ